jgi:hypothetical protein
MNIAEMKKQVAQGSLSYYSKDLTITGEVINTDKITYRTQSLSVRFTIVKNGIISTIEKTFDEFFMGETVVEDLYYDAKEYLTELKNAML